MEENFLLKISGVTIERTKLLRLLDPYGRNPDIVYKSNDELVKMLVDQHKNLHEFKLSDYEIRNPTSIVQTLIDTEKKIIEYGKQVIAKEEELKKIYFDLLERENKVKSEEDNLQRKLEEFLASKRNSSNRRDNVRPPDPVIKETLLDAKNIHLNENYTKGSKEEAELRRVMELSRNEFYQEMKKKQEEEDKVMAFIKESEQKNKVYNEKCYDEEEKDDLEEEINFTLIEEHVPNFDRKSVINLYKALKENDYKKGIEILGSMDLALSSRIKNLKYGDCVLRKHLIDKSKDSYKCLKKIIF